MTKEQVLTEIFANDPMQLLNEITITEHKTPGCTQYTVKRGNLTLVQTCSIGFKNNDCSINNGGTNEIVSSFDYRFRDLFVALNQYKN